MLMGLSACYKSDQQPSYSKTAEPQAIDQAFDEQTEQQEIPARKLIKDATVEFEVESISETRARVLEAVKQYGGYISSDEENQYDSWRRNTLVIRVPVANFETLLSEITEGVSHLDYKQISATDVTEEFVDIETRLASKKELEKRYLALLSRANTVSDILEIEKQANDLRTEIESIEGRFKYLKNRIALSTITLRMDETTGAPSGFGKKLADGFGNGWEYLLLFIVGMVSIWPFLLLGIGLFLGVRYLRRRRRNKVNSSS